MVTNINNTKDISDIMNTIELNCNRQYLNCQSIPACPQTGFPFRTISVPIALSADRQVSGHHSVRSDFTGFAITAFIAWKLTVINVIINAPTPDATNIHTDIDVL